MSTPSSTEASTRTVHEIEMVLNDDPVVLPQGKYTGSQILQAAIDQGVPHITVEFVLSLQKGDRWVVVGADELIQIHPKMTFLAVHGDDNS